ncbi:MAG: transposase, partial [Tepidanaerobacteraceae bacterium]|nr:transposase [Tepidanaerobacteraceae bacterium]
MLRGIDRRDIFLEDEDRKKFLYYLLRAKKIDGFELYGYCLMNNHAHILMKENEELGQSIKRITVGYAQW